MLSLKPKITIVTVVKNGAETVERSLQSVIYQDYTNIEVIVIVGKSNDQTLAIVNTLHNPRMSVYSFDDSGIYDALNKGISLATGEIVGLLHADDYLKDENVISRVIEGFRNNKVSILIGGLSYFKSDNPQKVTRRYFPANFKNWMFRFGMAPPHPSFYVKRELFGKYGNYRTDLEIAGDFDLMLRYLYFHKIPYQCVSDCWVMMSEGGKSTNGWQSIVKNNKDILTVCKSHNYYSNYIFIYAKYLLKSVGLFLK